MASVRSRSICQSVPEDARQFFCALAKEITIRLVRAIYGGPRRLCSVLISVLLTNFAFPVVAMVLAVYSAT